jgi:phage/plasmid-associated DNA primase
MKRFKADPTFMRRLPELAPYLLWTLFENYKQYKVTGLKEPNEVFAATGKYRAENDVYAQYIEECIHTATPEEIVADEKQDKYFLKLSELHTNFTDWYHLNYSSYAKDKFNKIVLMKEFDKKFPGASMKKGRMQGWYGYELIREDATVPPVSQVRKLPAPKAGVKTTTAPVASKAKVTKTKIAPPAAKTKVTKTKIAAAPVAAKVKTTTVVVAASTGGIAKVKTATGGSIDKSIGGVRPAPKSKVIRV